MKRGAVISALLVVLACGLWIAYAQGLLPGLGNAPDAADAPLRAAAAPEQSRRVVALGRLQPAGGILTISGTVGDRLHELTVAEGDTVVAGQVLGTLDSLELRTVELELARSQLSEAQARRDAEQRLAQAQVTSARLAEEQARATDHELDAQRQQIEALRVAVEQAQADLQRMANLSDELVSPQEREHQQLRVRQQQAELAAAEARLQALEQGAGFAVQVASAKRAAAEASQQQIVAAIPVESLEKQVELAALQLERAQVVAFSAGTVLQIYTRPGEFITQQPILQLANLERMICIAEVYETDVRHLRLGQPALIDSRALGERPADVLRGTVTRIGSMIMTPELKSLDPFAPVDRHVVEVHVELDAPSASLAARWVNLQVEVTFVDEDHVRDRARVTDTSVDHLLSL